MCQHNGGKIGGRGQPPLDPPKRPGCAVVGCAAHHHHRNRGRVCDRRGSGHKELTHLFAVFYISGCVVAALAVRQEGLFTAIIQPPLILFCAVPGAYWLFHGRKVGHLKDLLINCGYPLIERFPLMLGTAGGVLLIGLVRWYFGMSYGTAAAVDTEDDAAADADAATPAESRSFFGAVTAKLNSLLGVASREDGSGDCNRRKADSRGRPAPKSPSEDRPGGAQRQVHTPQPNPLPARPATVGGRAGTRGRAAAAAPPGTSPRRRRGRPAAPVAPSLGATR